MIEPLLYPNSLLITFFFWQNVVIFNSTLYKHNLNHHREAQLNSTKMNALQQIVNFKNHSLNIVLPNDFAADKVEVVVLSIDEPMIQPKLRNSERFAGAISKETAEKLHKHLNEVRNEWERDTFGILTWQFTTCNNSYQLQPKSLLIIY